MEDITGLDFAIWFFCIAVSMGLAVFSMFNRQWLTALATIFGCIIGVLPFFKFGENFATPILILGISSVTIILFCLFLQKHKILTIFVISCILLSTGYLSYINNEKTLLGILSWPLSFIFMIEPLLTTLAARLVTSFKPFSSIGEAN